MTRADAQRRWQRSTISRPRSSYSFRASCSATLIPRAVESVSRGTDVMDNVIWWDLARPMRQTVEFRRLVGAVELQQLWRVRGWPDQCHPKEAGDFVCDRFVRSVRGVQPVHCTMTSIDT